MAIAGMGTVDGYCVVERAGCALRGVGGVGGDESNGGMGRWRVTRYGRYGKDGGWRMADGGICV